jgi:rhodanese-related sulfurtransferase
MVFAEGMGAWEDKGYPIVAGPNYQKRVKTRKLSPRELQNLVKAHRGAVIVVDVRNLEEYKEGHIPGAIDIPLEVFASKSTMLGKDKTIVVYCNSGGRSYDAYRKLMQLGYKDLYQSLYYDWRHGGLPVEKQVFPAGN